MKKILVTTLVLGSVLLLVTGCFFSKTYKWEVATGDTILIKIGKDYEMNDKTPIKISKYDDEVMEGNFYKDEKFDELLNTITSNENYKIIERNYNDDIEYIFFSYDDEYSYIIKIKDSNTSMMLRTEISETTARECFESMTIKKK